VAIDDQLISSSDLHVVLEPAVGGVVLHLVRKVLSIRGHVHNTNDVELGAKEALVADCLEDHAADAAKAIDANSGCHC